MIHRYAAYIDDLCQTDAHTVIGSDDDPAYVAENLTQENPAKPAKAMGTSASWVIDFGSDVTAKASAVLYHNAVTLLLEANSSDSWVMPPFSEMFTILAPDADGWTFSPWIEFDPATYRYWRLTATSTSVPVGIGRLCILAELREAWSDEPNDVRWGEEEIEEHGVLELATELGVETLYPLGGKRRRFNGELALRDTTAAEFIALVRRSGGRVNSWLLIPNASVNDAWIVRFEQNNWSRTRETINHNIFPFRVQELSRGLPWP